MLTGVVSTKRRSDLQRPTGHNDLKTTCNDTQRRKNDLWYDLNIPSSARQLNESEIQPRTGIQSAKFPASAPLPLKNQNGSDVLKLPGGQCSYALAVIKFRNNFSMNFSPSHHPRCSQSRSNTRRHASPTNHKDRDHPNQEQDPPPPVCWYHTYHTLVFHCNVLKNMMLNVENYK